MMLRCRFSAGSLLTAWQTAEDGPRPLGPCCHVGDSEEAPRFNELAASYGGHSDGRVCLPNPVTQLETNKEVKLLLYKKM